MSGTPEIPNDAANPAGRRSLIKAGQRNRTGTLVSTALRPKTEVPILVSLPPPHGDPPDAPPPTSLFHLSTGGANVPRPNTLSFIFSQSIEHLPSLLVQFTLIIFRVGVSYVSSSTLILPKQSLYPYRHFRPTLCFSVQPRVSRSRSPDCAHRNRNAHQRSRVSVPLHTQKKRS